jgi:hypothetical protein
MRLLQMLRELWGLFVTIQSLRNSTLTFIGVVVSKPSCREIFRIIRRKGHVLPGPTHYFQTSYFWWLKQTSGLLSRNYKMAVEAFLSSSGTLILGVIHFLVKNLSYR